MPLPARSVVKHTISFRSNTYASIVIAITNTSTTKTLAAVFIHSGGSHARIGSSGTMADKFPPPPMKVTKEEMDAARVPYAWRDYCAHLLIPLNECRESHYFMPWACGHERHVYEKCQYKEWKRRVAVMTELKRRQRNAELGAGGGAPA